MAQRIELGDGAWVELSEGFVVEPQAMLQRLRETLPLRVEALQIYGRSVATPRLTSWHGDRHCVYRYSGRYFTPQPWTPELLALRQQLRAQLGIDFNSVLVNYYRDGSDSMGWHADDEPELGPSRDKVVIASVSLGEPRRFALRTKPWANNKARYTFELGDGNLLVMGGTTQQHFQHQIAKTRRPCGPRLNLTFRLLCDPRDTVGHCRER